MMNKKGDRGSPCLTPWEDEKNPIRLPLISTKNFAPDKHEEIHLHHFELKINLVRTYWRKAQLTLSYTFIMSNLTTMASLLCLVTE